MGNDPSAILIALGAVLLLMLIMRWTFRSSRPRRAGRPVDAADSPDLGLLTVVLSGLDRQEALRRRAALGAAGIRSSMSKRRDGTLDVLVFHGDVRAAQIVLGP